jgi:hypothetical protein
MRRILRSANLSAESTGTNVSINGGHFTEYNNYVTVNHRLQDSNYRESNSAFFYQLLFGLNIGF